jgi:hypothetical protein
VYPDNQSNKRNQKICAICGEHPTTGLRNLREMPYGLHNFTLKSIAKLEAVLETDLLVVAANQRFNSTHPYFSPSL